MRIRTCVFVVVSMAIAACGGRETEGAAERSAPDAAGESVAPEEQPGGSPLVARPRPTAEQDTAFERWARQALLSEEATEDSVALAFGKPDTVELVPRRNEYDSTQVDTVR